MALPPPDKPPATFHAPKKAPRYRASKVETFKKADGSWGQRPIEYKPVTGGFPPLTTRIEVTPIQKRVQKIARKHSGPML